MIEEKIILFQSPNKLGLSKEEILLKFQNNRNLINFYHESNSNVITDDDKKVKNRFNDKIVIDNLYKSKINPSKQLEIDFKKDFNEVKKEFKKTFENIYFDIDNSSLKWNIKLKEIKSEDIFFIKTRRLSSIFQQPLNFKELSNLTPIEYICSNVLVFKPITNRLTRIFNKYSEITNDYSSSAYIDRTSLFKTILNFNLIERSPNIEDFLTFLGIDKTKQEFLLNEFLAICVFSERFFLDTSNLKLIYEYEDNLSENLDFRLIELNEIDCSENLKNLLLLIAKQSKTLYLNYNRNSKSQKSILYLNEYRSSNYVKINQLKK